MMLLLQIVIVIFLSFSSVSSITIEVDGQYPLCLNNGNFTANDAYQSKLDSLFNSIATTNSSAMAYGLFNESIGPQQGSDGVEMMGYCRGDQFPDACRACLYNSAFLIRRQCQLYKQAVLFGDNCTIKYSNSSMYGVVSTDPYWVWWNANNASNWDTFVKEVKQLLVDLQSEAASGGPLRKYAAGNRSAGLETVYAAVQCSPDLNQQQCVDCLVDITVRLTPGKIGGRLWAQSCQLRFEDYRFFDPTVPPPSPPPPPVESKTWIVIVASVVSAVLLICILVFLTAKRLRNRSKNEVIDDDVDTVESLRFDLVIIRAATYNFSEANKLGRGGFGSVFRGQLLCGQEIAVKRLSQNSGQGESEFKNEARLLSRLQHRNLVRFLGYCLEGIERLLVYEFVPNSSLDKFIFDPLKRALLDWDTRYKIITGITRGLLYLHEDSRLRIIHRDLKASNILLDMDMNPKISDFGMARLFELDQTQADTNRIMGTYGYMAPEYAGRGNFSVKSDVFSFGVLVLEIVSGRRNLIRHSGEDSEMLISHTWTNWREGNISNIVDLAVSSGYNANILRSIHIGLLCVQENATNRPEMASVVRWLDNHSVTLAVPTQPAFFTGTSSGNNISSVFDSTLRTTEDDRSRNNAGTFSINEASITKPYPR